MQTGKPCLMLSAVLMLTFISTLITQGLAAQVQLAWDAPANDPADIGGYMLYYWQPEWDIPASVDVGDQRTYTLIGLEAGHTYAFAVTAYDFSGHESGYSNVVRTALPPPPDTEAPTVAITAPADGTLIIGSPVSVSASASDNVGVVGLQFLLDGVNLQNEITTAPYTIEWDTATVTAGAYKLASRARDAAGNHATSAAVTVTISNLRPPLNPTDAVDGGLSNGDEGAMASKPNVPETDDGSINEGDEAVVINPQPSSLFKISTPNDGDELAGNAVSIAVSDLPIGTSTVLIQALPVDAEDPILSGETWAEPFLVEWDTSAHKDGEYVIRAVAMSSENKPIMTATITVTVNNTTSDEADIIEDNGSKLEVIDADKDQVVITSDGVIVEIAAGAFATHDKISIQLVDVADVAGILPGDAAGMIVALTTERGQHFFDTDVTIRIPYVDDDQDGLIDGTTIAETTLTMWFFDGVDWIQLLDTEVLPDDNVVVGWTDHFTEFGVFGISLESDSMNDNAPPTQSQSQDGSGGDGSSCFIATAAFGSPLEPQVQVLREFRDTYLLTNSPGQWLMTQYYQLSPPIADFIRDHDNMRAIVRVGLTPVVLASNFMLQSTGTQKIAIAAILLSLCFGMVWVGWGLSRTNSSKPTSLGRKSRRLT